MKDGYYAVILLASWVIALLIGLYVIERERKP